MIAAIIALVMALISYFTAKKSGASDAAALGVAAVAGAGSYYVATQTDWGKSVVSSIDTTWGELFGSDGEKILDSDGNPIIGPVGSVPKVDSAGNIVRDTQGNPIFELAGKLVSTGGEVLQSWGPLGTVGAIGGIAALTQGIPAWVLFAGAGLLLITVLK